MRVIAGKAKGHQLKAPKGSSTRPTSDLVRGAIFDILETVAGNWSRVLDLYAGAGTLGIEALSRGAGWADFVEREVSCCSVIKENLERTKLAEYAHVYCCTVKKALSFLKGFYGVVLLDPPYDDPRATTILAEVATSPLVGTASVIVIEHSSRLTLAPAYGKFNLLKTRRHGDTCISVYRQEE